MLNINFADDWIQTTDLWYPKQKLCQLSHNHCPNDLMFECNNGQLTMCFICSQSYKAPTILRLYSRNCKQFTRKYESKVVIYARRGFIRWAIDCELLICRNYVCSGERRTWRRPSFPYGARKTTICEGKEREREVNGKSYKGRRMTIKQTNGGKKEKERSFEEI